MAITDQSGNYADFLAAQAHNRAAQGVKSAHQLRPSEDARSREKSYGDLLETIHALEYHQTGWWQDPDCEKQKALFKKLREHARVLGEER